MAGLTASEAVRVLLTEAQQQEGRMRARAARTARWQAQVAQWKAWGLTPDRVRQFRELGLPDHEMIRWAELQQACGYADDEITNAAQELMRTRLRRIRGW